MAKSTATSKVKVYVRTHWIKIGIAAVFLFILMKKDLSFSINLNAPAASPTIDKKPSPEKIKENKKDILSDKKLQKEVSSVTKMSIAPLSNFLGENTERSDKFWRLDEREKVKFIERFTHVAENEQLKYGVPASIIIASGLLLSEAGRSDLARDGNNYFALPCTVDWMGEEGHFRGTCFRFYENAWTSFRDNSLYLTTLLFPGKQIPTVDYKSWAFALEQVNYGDEPNLAAQLLKIIDHYGLADMDH